MFGGQLWLAGASTTVSAGTASNIYPAPAVWAASGRVDVDPAVTLVPRNGAQPIEGNAVVTYRRVPSTWSGPIPPGGLWEIELHAPAGSPFCLFASASVPRTATPYGELWFDLSAHAVLACQTVGAGETVRLAMTVPVVLARGIPVVVQAGVAHSGGVELSQPGVSIVW